MAYSIVITTCPDMKEADELASAILESRLAACIQVSSIKSYYTWKEAVKNDPEYKLLIKCPTRLYEKLERFILDRHSYEVPEIVQVPISAGLKAYLDWVDEETEG